MKKIKLSIIQSKNINDYKPILEGLVGDFGHIYYHAILTWCGIINADWYKDNKYWQVYLVKHDDNVVGICGLYSHYENSIDELWLGWFGTIPEFRNKKIGQFALEWMIENSKSIGCSKIMSYVNTDGKPLSFYYRNGFKRICSVSEYLEIHKDLNIDEFEGMDDHVIEFKMPSQ